jgi:MFS family permease
MKDQSASEAIATWRLPQVRAYTCGRVLAVIGQAVFSVAVGWLLYERTGSAMSLGIVGIVELVPVLLLMIPAGNAADRFPRRNLTIISYGICALAAIGLAAVAWLGWGARAIYAMVALAGVGSAIGASATRAILPQLLAADELASANAWIQTLANLGRVTGPALGGIIISATGSAAWAFAAATAGLVGGMLLIALLPAVSPPPADAASRRSAAELFAGFSFVRHNRLFLAAITLDLFAVLFGGAVALLPIYAKDILKVGPEGLGWLRAAPSLGSMAMAFLVTRLPPWRHPGRVLLVAVAGFGLATVGFGLSTNLLLSLVCLFFTGFCDSISVVIRLTLEQVMTPDALRGRVSAVNSVFIGLSNELGSFESGTTAALFGPVISVVGGGAISLLVVTAVMFIWPELARLGPLHTIRPAESPGA